MRLAILVLATCLPAVAAAQGFTPTFLSTLAIPGYANNVDVQGNYAYVAAGAAGLQVVNVANPSSPVIVAALDTPGNANDVRVVGTRAYVADGSSGLRIIDITNPLAPLSLGAMDTVGEANDVIVSGDLVFVADGAAGVAIINASNPAAPVLVRTVDTPGIARGVAAEGSTLVVAADFYGLIVIDVTEPVSAAIVGSVIFPGDIGGNAKDVDLAGGYAYVAAYTRGVFVVDVSTPTAPVVVANLPGGGIGPGGFVPRDVEVAGRYAVFAEQLYAAATAPIVDITTPSVPVVHALLSMVLDYAGTGIALRGAHVFWTGEAFIVGPENGVTGNTRLFIGQYLSSTTTTLVSSPNPSTEGEAVTLQATVVGVTGSGGTVEFFDGPDSLGTAPLAGGSAELDVSTLSVGSHVLSAHYDGDESSAPSVSAPVEQVVDAPISYALTVLTDGGGTGTVVSDDGKIACPGTCSDAYVSGSMPTLTATGEGGAVFTGWSGDCAGTDPCVLTMDADKTVTATFAVNGRDLVVSAISEPVALASPGGVYDITDTTRNQGALAVGASSTRFYLSLDGVKSADDVLMAGSRIVPVLDTGTESIGVAPVTIPTSITPGIYRQLACADDKKTVAESNEANNCLASAGSIQIVLPDLLETAVSSPPAAIAPGAKFTVTDTVHNGGAVPAAASQTRYYLSVDAVKDGSDVLLKGARKVPVLVAAGDSAGSKAVTVPAATAPGTYRLLACADDQKKVPEANEGNNCRAAAGSVLVALPDMTATEVSGPGGAAPGQKVTLSDVTINQGAGPAGATSTRYYFSLDRFRSAGDVLLSGSRSVPGLAPGGTSAGSKGVTLPAATPAGTYYALACADDTTKLAESHEGNNCVAAATTITVAP